MSILFSLVVFLLLSLHSNAQFTINKPLIKTIPGIQFAQPTATATPGGLPKFEINPNLQVVKDKFRDFQFKTLPEAQQYPFGSVSVADPEITKGKRIKIPLAPPHADPYDATAAELRESVLNLTLPIVMSQLGFSDAQITAKIPKAYPAVSALLRTLPGQKGGRDSVARRDIFGDIVDIFEGIACSVVAATALPVFLITENDFSVLNHGSAAITQDQQFFAYPIYKDLALTAPIHIYYDAYQPPVFEFGTVEGTTFNRNIYIKRSAPNTPDSSTTRLLLHEMKHVQQYADKDWSLALYGLSYLYGWCKAGFSYSNIPEEIEAREWASHVDKLLVWPSPGCYFFDVWRVKNLFSTLGYPVSQDYSNVPGLADAIELPFQVGALQVQLKPKVCYRLFNTDELVSRAAATCTLQPDCPRRKRAPAPKQRDCQPGDDSCEDPKTPGHRDYPDKCKQSDINAANNACSARKNQWAAIAGKPWLCDAAVGPPPSAQPGCPTNCGLVQQIPVTSKSCKSDNPPDGCFDAAEHNAWCRAERERCGQ
ncbi:hypothetical protein QBC47DRAFT_418108 [Echria macrotheca]|uniref:DUF4157 domain-containing protein n=1 Tax=Echria macrotheca TaxID=438768 RepID=A0AAJ0F4G9_9PEZI|nr:hypothetical protein QBC47DRAFT_418108 [Echria macrotheca]